MSQKSLFLSLVFLFLLFSFVLSSSDDDMEPEEMDQQLACQFLTQSVLAEKEEFLKEVQKANQTDFRKFLEKIWMEMFEQCLNKINLEIARNYFNNLTIVDVSSAKREHLNLINVELKEFLDKNNQQISQSQMILYSRFVKVKELFDRKQRDTINRNKQEGGLKIADFDLNNISPWIKTLVFIILISITFGGVLLALNKLQKKNEGKNKRKKK